MVYLWSDGYVGWPPAGGRLLKPWQARWVLDWVALADVAEMPALTERATHRLQPVPPDWVEHALTEWLGRGPQPGDVLELPRGVRVKLAGYPAERLLPGARPWCSASRRGVWHLPAQDPAALLAALAQWYTGCL